MASDFGAYMRQKRIEADLTLEEVAERVGVEYPTVQRYEVGKRNVPVEFVPKWAVAVGVNKSDAIAEWVAANTGEELTREPLFPGRRIPAGYENEEDPIVRAAIDAAEQSYDQTFKSVADALRKHGSRFSLGAVPNEQE